jgi:hypothetical protein
MKCNYDSWPVGNGDIAVYTEEIDVAKLLTELIGKGATYERAGTIYAWQFILPRTKRRFVELRITRKMDVDSKRVTAVSPSKFSITGPEVRASDN